MFMWTQIRLHVTFVDRHSAQAESFHFLKFTLSLSLKLQIKRTR